MFTFSYNFVLETVLDVSMQLLFLLVILIQSMFLFLDVKEISLNIHYFVELLMQ